MIICSEKLHQQPRRYLKYLLFFYQLVIRLLSGDVKHLVREISFELFYLLHIEIDTFALKVHCGYSAHHSSAFQKGIITLAVLLLD